MFAGGPDHTRADGGGVVAVGEENQPGPGMRTPVQMPVPVDRRGESQLPEPPYRSAEPVALLSDLIAGMVGLALRGLDDIIHPARPGIGRTPRTGPGPGTRFLIGAGLAVPVAVAHGSAAVVTRLGGMLRPLVELATERTPLGGPIRAGRRSLRGLADREREEQERRERASASAIGRLIELVAGAVIERIDVDAIIARVDLPTVIDRIDVDAVVAKVDIDAVVSRLDLDGIVSRVDLDRVVNRLDLDAIVARVDLDRVVNRLDLDAIVARVDLDRVVNRLDLDAIVARVDLDAVLARVDIDSVAARVDIQAILDRVDIAALTRQVMDEVDFGQIIRESSGTMTRETVDAIRYQGMNADRLVARIVDRILLRRYGRDATIPAQSGPPADDRPATITP
jgi:hypothetical protein